MSEQWNVVLNEHNTALMTACDASDPAYAGVGRYVFDIPDRFYTDCVFDFAARLDAQVEGVKCKIYYHGQICCQFQDRPTDMSKSGDCTMVVGYFSRFDHNTPAQSTRSVLRPLGFPEWKACLVIEFLTSDDVPCHPGEWALHLDFTFESLERIIEANREAIQQHRAEEEAAYIRAKMQMEAAAFQ